MQIYARNIEQCMNGLKFGLHLNFQHDYTLPPIDNKETPHHGKTGGNLMQVKLSNVLTNKYGKLHLPQIHHHHIK